MADWGYALGQGIGAGAQAASGLIDAGLKEDADIRAADRQLDLQTRLVAAQEAMQKRVQENAYQIQQRPNQEAGELLRNANAPVAVAAPEVTELSGADPNSPYKSPDGEPTQGLSGNYKELRARYEKVPDPALRTELLTQLDRQYEYEKQKAAESVSGQTRAPSREEQLKAAMDAALAEGKLQSYAALKAQAAEKFVPLNDNGLYNTATGEIIAPPNNKADMEAARDERRFQNQLALQDARDEAAGRRADSREDARTRALTDKEEAKAKAERLKPLPATALKQRQTELDAIGTASGIQDQIGSVQKQIDSGKLEFGPVSNMINRARNAAGRSSEESVNFANFQSTMEKLRNDSLRLNAGVQTDGDAQRAWNELFANINDTGVVKQRLQEIKNINARAVQLRKQNIDLIQANYGKDPLDVSNYQNPGAANSGGRPSLDDIFK